LQVENGLCVATDTAEVLFIEQPVANAGPHVAVCGNQAEITGIDGVGIGAWILPSAISTSQTLTDPTIAITGGSYGSFEIVRTVSHLSFCTDTDTTTVRFTELSIVNLGADQNVCDSITMVNFIPPVGELNWQLSPNLLAI